MLQAGHATETRRRGPRYKYATAAIAGLHAMVVSVRVHVGRWYRLWVVNHGTFGLVKRFELQRTGSMCRSPIRCWPAVWSMGIQGRTQL